MHSVKGRKESGAFERGAIPISLKNGDGAASRWRNGRKQRKEGKGKNERKKERKKEEKVGRISNRETNGRVGVLGGSVCRVAWPIVCKGSRSSSKEPAEEEEEGSEAN